MFRAACTEWVPFVPSLGLHLGVHEPDGYTSIKEPATESCVNLYETHGIDFVTGPNGNFVGIIHDQWQDQLHLFTDRLGTWPLHLAETDHRLAFSSNIQSLLLVPSVDTDYLAEYFALKHVFGVKTPLKGVEKTQSGSVTTVCRPMAALRLSETGSCDMIR